MSLSSFVVGLPLGSRNVPELLLNVVSSLVILFDPMFDKLAE